MIILNIFGIITFFMHIHNTNRPIDDQNIFAHLIATRGEKVVTCFNAKNQRLNELNTGHRIQSKSLRNEFIPDSLYKQINLQENMIRFD